MYLKAFPMEKKRTILDLGIYAAMSDQVMTDEEKAVVDKIIDEMEMKHDYKPIYSLNDTLYDLNRDFSDQEKLQIFLETVGVVASDHITPREEDFLRSLQKTFGISDEKYKIAEGIAKDFLRVNDILNEYFS